MKALVLFACLGLVSCFYTSCAGTAGLGGITFTATTPWGDFNSINGVTSISPKPIVLHPDK